MEFDPKKDMSRVLKSRLSFEDGIFAYELSAFGDITQIDYYEEASDSTELKLKSSYNITSGYDVILAEEIIRLRKLKEESDSK